MRISNLFQMNLESVTALNTTLYSKINYKLHYPTHNFHYCQATGTGPGPGIGYWDWGWENGKWKMENGNWKMGIESTPIPSPRR